MPLILLFIQYSFNAQHVSAVNTTIFRSLRLTGCYFMGGIWFGVCWRSVSVWLWLCGVFMQSEARNEYWINNKISGIKLVLSLLNYKDDARSHKHKIQFSIFAIWCGRRKGKGLWSDWLQAYSHCCWSSAFIFYRIICSSSELKFNLYDSNIHLSILLICCIIWETD